MTSSDLQIPGIRSNVSHSSVEPSKGWVLFRLKDTSPYPHLPGGEGGGGRELRYQKATHRQMAMRSRSGERQNIGAVKAKKGGSQLQTKHLIRIVACKMFWFSLYFVKYMMFFLLKMIYVTSLLKSLLHTILH